MLEAVPKGAFDIDVAKCGDVCSVETSRPPLTTIPVLSLRVGVGQVFLADETLSGCVIVGALAVCSPGSAVVAVLGSGLGLAVGILMQVPLGGLYAGLWGYNAVLGCMAVGGVFFYPSAVSFALAGLCAVVSDAPSPLSSCFSFHLAQAVKLTLHHWFPPRISRRRRRRRCSAAPLQAGSWAQSLHRSVSRP